MFRLFLNVFFLMFVVIAEPPQVRSEKVLLKRIEIKDTILSHTLDSIVINNPGCFLQDESLFFSMEIGQSCYEDSLYLIKLNDFTGYLQLKESIGYYCMLGGRLFVLPKYLPKELVTECDDSFMMKLEEGPSYIDRDMLFLIRYVPGKGIYSLKEFYW